MELIVTAPVALRATAELAGENRDRLLQRYAASYVKKAIEIEEHAGNMPDIRPAACCEIAEGGIEAALWRLAEAEKTGLRVDLRSIPIRQETVEVCNTLDLDPYRLASYGSWLFFVQNGAEVLAELHRQGCTEAAVIGCTADDKKRILYYSGVERYILPPQRYG